MEATQFSHEAIAIGAFKVEINKDLSVRKLYKGFKKYVLAKERIGKLVTNLTGITEEQLDKEGVHFAVMQRQLKEYIGVPYEKCMFIAFGNNDIHILRQSLQYNIHSDKEDIKIIGNNYLDFSDILGEFIRDENGNIYSLANYLKYFNIEPEGEAHDPLYDAKNLYLLYVAVLNNQETLIKGYKELIKHKTFQPYVVQKVMNKLNNGENVTPEDLDKFIREYISK